MNTTNFTVDMTTPSWSCDGTTVSNVLTGLSNTSIFANDDPSKYSMENLCKVVLCRNIHGNTLYERCENEFLSLALDIKRIELLHQHVSSASKIVLCIFLVSIFLTSICGNTLVVLTFVVNKHMRSVTNVFILSLAVSDLMATVACVPIDMGQVLSPAWKFGQFGCKLYPCLMQFFVSCSSLTLCLIAFDRYYAIIHPLKLKLLQTPRRAAFLQIIVWTISASSSAPLARFNELISISICKEPEEEVSYTCGVPQKYNKAYEAFVIWVSLVVMFIGPILFISIMYGVVSYRLWVRTPIGAATQKNSDGRLRLKRKAIKMLITVVLLYVICMSPQLLFNAIAVVDDVQATEATLTARDYLWCISLSSTCWNPIVYAFMNEKFRKAFQTVLTCRRGRVVPSLVRANTNRNSVVSRKTTSQLEAATLTIGSQQTSETKI